MGDSRMVKMCRDRGFNNGYMRCCVSEVPWMGCLCRMKPR